MQLAKAICDSVPALKGVRLRTSKLKPFAGLPDDDKLYVLDWFGGVHPNPDEHDNDLIQCFFTPLGGADSVTGASRYYRLGEGQICANTAVGYLPALFLGQAYRNGERTPLIEWPKMETLTVEFDTEAAELDLTLADIRLNRFPIDKNHQDSAHRTHVTKVECKQVSTDNENAKWSNGKSLSLLFPDIELIRYYLTNSSHSCKAIFSGAFQDNELGKRVINENKISVTLDPVTRSGDFVYRLGYTHEDVLSLGRILFEPHDYALKAAQQVCNSVVADRVNLNTPTHGYPSTYFPFQGTTRLCIKGRRLLLAEQSNGEKQFIFLVQQIVSCSGKFPFSELNAVCEITPGGDPAQEDAPFAFSNIKTNDRGPAHDAPDKGESKSNERPDTNSVPIDVQIGERIFDDLVNIKLTNEKRTASTHQAQKRFNRRNENLLDASTGRSTSGESSAVRQSITEPNVKPLPIPSDLETFIKVLAAISGSRTTWKIKPVKAGDADKDEAGLLYSFFPIVKCAIRKSQNRQFSYMDESQHIRRRLVCAELCVVNQYVYLLEAQRRPRELQNDPKNTELYKEELPILLLKRPGYVSVSGNDFANMLEKTVECRTWPSQRQILDFVRDYTVHGMGAQSVQIIANRIIEMVERNLPTGDSIANLEEKLSENTEQI